ncbi:hypothetical protein PGTUg99_023214 [Puccinia graminis f. sp. tritici]|uniref:Uncharacterized protein n=1 Tax=Puccinia graminis f. sp. tritici TaxID=56615 RepID=A0A5B0LP15_PUCGR|nr:hypothetical protein PGTUg99_023214 [Puccinia graminis f. sp. tritici]
MRGNAGKIDLNWDLLWLLSTSSFAQFCSSLPVLASQRSDIPFLFSIYCLPTSDRDSMQKIYLSPVAFLVPALLHHLPAQWGPLTVGIQLDPFHHFFQKATWPLLESCIPLKSRFPNLLGGYRWENEGKRGRN